MHIFAERYGNETWAILRQDKKKILPSKIRFLRDILGHRFIHRNSQCNGVVPILCSLMNISSIFLTLDRHLMMLWSVPLGEKHVIRTWHIHYLGFTNRKQCVMSIVLGVHIFRHKPEGKWYYIASGMVGTQTGLVGLILWSGENSFVRSCVFQTHMQ